MSVRYDPASHIGGGLAAIPERFWQKVMPDTNAGCWLWAGYLSADGYGRFGWGAGGIHVAAYRFSYECVFGPIPDELVMDHKCRVTACVNPWHVEPVTVTENGQRTRGYRHKRRSVCKSGHTLNEHTALERYPHGWRCRVCHRDYERERYQRGRTCQ